MPSRASPGKRSPGGGAAGFANGDGILAQNAAARVIMESGITILYSLAIVTRIASREEAVPSKDAAGVLARTARRVPGQFVREVALRDADADDVGGNEPVCGRRTLQALGEEALDHQRALAVSGKDERAAAVVVRKVMVERAQDVAEGKIVGLLAIGGGSKSGQRGLAIARREDSAAGIENAGLPGNHADVGPVVRFRVRDVGIPCLPAAEGCGIDKEDVNRGAGCGGGFPLRHQQCRRILPGPSGP